MKFGTRREARGFSETVSVLILLVMAVLLASVTSYNANNNTTPCT